MIFVSLTFELIAITSSFSLKLNYVMPTIFMVLLVSYSFLDILSVFKLLMALYRHLIHYPFLDISTVTFALLPGKKKVSHLLAST